MKKTWNKPELKRLVAGAAEKSKNNNRPDDVTQPSALS
jgi:hypothetical protein